VRDQQIVRVVRMLATASNWMVFDIARDNNHLPRSGPHVNFAGALATCQWQTAQSSLAHRGSASLRSSALQPPSPQREWEDDQLIVSAMLGGRHNSDRFIYHNRAMNLIVLLIILIILFGGGGFYYGGPYVGGGLGTVLLIILIVLLLR
jgi:hypothetical protein